MSAGPVTAAAMRLVRLDVGWSVVVVGPDEASCVAPMAPKLTDNAPGRPEVVW